MRIRHALPVLAAFALVACGGDADTELADEALSADEVAGAGAPLVEATFAMPSPGQYSTTQELVSFDLPALAEADLAKARAEFADGAATAHNFCVSENMSRDEWLSQLAESSCTMSRVNGDGSALDVVLSCTGAEGLSGRVAAKGTANATGSDVELSWAQPIPGKGDATIAINITSERTGDCS